MGPTSSERDSPAGLGRSVTAYRHASERGDIGALRGTLADDVELVSPIVAWAVFRGRDDVCALLNAI
jgi:hypothetical protein